MGGSVAFVLKGYPRLSETFIAQEIEGLERRGIDIVIVSLRHPTDPHTHPVHREIRATVIYLPEYLYQEPARVLRGWRHARRLPGYRAARNMWLRDLVRDPTPNRVRRLGQALVLAAELPEKVRSLHAHFIHTPASVARYAAAMRMLPWSCSAHAKDIWTLPTWEKAEKIADCSWITTCSGAARAHLAELAPDEARKKLSLIYHGLDFARFPPPVTQRPASNGRDGNAPVVLLSVGRAVEKKGHDVLISALDGLPSDLNWRLIHVGTGPLLNDLKRKAERHGIARRLEWLGAQPQERVLDAYRSADVFVLASRIARDGDRDGLPNVLLEAQSQMLCCVASRISAIPELIEDGVTGILVPPDDAAALTRALASLITDPERRRELGRAGKARVRARFSSSEGIARIADMLDMVSSVPAPEPDQFHSEPCASRSTHP